MTAGISRPIGEDVTVGYADMLAALPSFSLILTTVPGFLWEPLLSNFPPPTPEVKSCSQPGSGTQVAGETESYS